MKIIDENNVEFTLGNDDYLLEIEYNDLDSIPTKKINLLIRQGMDIKKIIVDETIENNKIIALQIKKQQSNLS